MADSGGGGKGREREKIAKVASTLVVENTQFRVSVFSILLGWNAYFAMNHRKKDTM